MPMYRDWQIVIDQRVIDAIKKSFILRDLKKVYAMIASSPAPQVKKDVLVQQILAYIRAHRKSLPVAKGVTHTPSALFRKNKK